MAKQSKPKQPQCELRSLAAFYDDRMAKSSNSKKPHADLITKKPLPVQEKPFALLKDGLPFQGFAFVGDRERPDTWLLPHHTKAVKKAAAGKIGYEHTVDWEAMTHCTLLLSRQGVEGQRVIAEEPGQIIAAARHLAGHYRKAGRQIPDALCVLI